MSDHNGFFKKRLTAGINWYIIAQEKRKNRTSNSQTSNTPLIETRFQVAQAQTGSDISPNLTKTPDSPMAPSGDLSVALGSTQGIMLDSSHVLHCASTSVQQSEEEKQTENPQEAFFNPKLADLFADHEAGIESRLSGPEMWDADEAQKERETELEGSKEGD